MSTAIAGVFLAGAATNEGRLELAADGLNWYARGSGRTVSIPGASIKSLAWYDFGKYCQLWVTSAGSGGAGAGAGAAASSGSTTLHRFDGLRTTDYARINDHAKGAFSKNVTKGTLSAKGQTFGSVRIAGGELELVDVDGALVAPLPLSAVASAAVPGRGEVEVQLADEDTVEREDECLVELRLYVPEDAELPGITDGAAKKAKGGAGAGGEEEEDEEEDGDGAADPAKALHRRIIEGAGISGEAGQAIAELPETVGSFLVPRGRFAVELYPTLLRMTGASYEFKVAYKSIARITYLPLPSGMAASWEEATKYALVISLDDPLRQGTQRHPHLVMQLDRKQGEIDIRVSEEDRAAGRYEGLGAEPSVKGEWPKMVGMLLKKITGKPVYKPDSFVSAGKQRAVRCNHKGGGGLLYPLDRSLIFIHKPTVLIRYPDIASIEVQRSGGADGAASTTAARSFDLIISCRAAAGEPKRDYAFAQVDKSEQKGLVEFFRSKNLTVVEPTEKRSYAEAGDDLDLDDEDEDDEEDEDYGGAGSDDEEDSAGSDDDDDDEEDGGSDDGSEGAGFKRKRKGAKKEKKKSSKGKGKGKGKKEKKKAKKRGGSDDDE